MVENYLMLFFDSLFSAIIVPPRRESVLPVIIALQNNRYQLELVALLAILGNVLGSVFNWFIGRYFIFIKEKKVQANNAEKHQKLLIKYMHFLIPFSFLSLIGAPLCFVAGFVRIKLLNFLLLLILGKLIYYNLLIFCGLDLDISRFL
jgi:membrane protein YqaA with SNARE-associated domain